MRERRRNQRTQPLKQFSGSLAIHCNEQTLPALAVQDISPYGTCIQVEQPVSIDSEIALSYRAEALHLNLLATVVWCDLDSPTTQDGERYRIGLHFSQADMQQNTLLFRALLQSSHEP